MATKGIALSIEPEITDDLKSKGINRSEFFRQAYKAMNEGLWEFDMNQQR